MPDQPQPAGAGLARLSPGLYLVATPIGAARDITLRALDILAGADAIAAEDTRTARKLMEIHGVALAGRPMLAYHDHSGAGARERIAAMIAAGKSVAYVSEAGTPLVADPGYQLSRAVIEAGLPVLAAPGASAVLAALAVSGLPSDRFLFAGFPPQAKGGGEDMAGRACADRRDADPVRIAAPRSPIVRCYGGGSGRRAADRAVPGINQALRRGLARNRRRGAKCHRGSQPERRNRAGDRQGRAGAGQCRNHGGCLAQGAGNDVGQGCGGAVAADLGLKKRDVYQAALKLEAGK